MMFVQSTPMKLVNAVKGKYLAAALLLAVASALGLLFFFAPDQYSFYPHCVFYSLTGLQCPGCGGLRATHRLLHGDIAAAFHFNSLLVMLLPASLLLGFAYVMGRLSGHDWLRPFRRPFWLWLLLALIVVFAIVRNLRLHG